MKHAMQKTLSQIPVAVLPIMTSMGMELAQRHERKETILRNIIRTLLAIMLMTISLSP